MVQLHLPGSSPTASYSIAQVTSDVTEWDTLFAPDDDIHGVLVAELKRAVAAKAICYSSQYGFTDPDVADLFAKLGQQANSRFLFDKTQEAGKAEKPIVKALCAKLRPGQWAIGTSPVAGQILHTKAIALIYPDGVSDWVLTGSYNLSASAAKQFNIVDCVRSPSRALLFANRITSMFDWVKTHEGGNRP